MHCTWLQGIDMGLAFIMVRIGWQVQELEALHRFFLAVL